MTSFYLSYSWVCSIWFGRVSQFRAQIVFGKPGMPGKHKPYLAGQMQWQTRITNYLSDDEDERLHTSPGHPETVNVV